MSPKMACSQDPIHILQEFMAMSSTDFALFCGRHFRKTDIWVFQVQPLMNQDHCPKEQ